MEEKTIKEWFLETTWGRIAMISWGESHRPPVLLVHGWLDSVATFVPLLRQLPDMYYYVGFDFPGHGKSDPVSSGPIISKTFLLEIVRRVVDHLQWERFDYLTHSMGCVIGLFYQHLYPGRIQRMINLDPLLPISHYYHFTHNLKLWYKVCYESYYDQYQRLHTPSKLLTHEQAVNSVMLARNLSQEQAEVVLSRSLVPAGNGLYRLSTQSSMRFVTQYPAHEDRLRYILSASPPPMLNLIASASTYLKGEKEFGMNLLSVLDNSTQHQNVHIQGNHDVHITNPELLVPHIVEFLSRIDNFKSKL